MPTMFWAGVETTDHHWGGYWAWTPPRQWPALMSSSFNVCWNCLIIIHCLLVSFMGFMMTIWPGVISAWHDPDWTPTTETALRLRRKQHTLSLIYPGVLPVLGLPRPQIPIQILIIMISMCWQIKHRTNERRIGWICSRIQQAASDSTNLYAV